MIYHAGKMYYSLSEIAPAHLYSPEYLRVRIHQKKLQGVKFDGVWHSTKEWLQEYGNRFGKRVDGLQIESVYTDEGRESTKGINRVNLNRGSVERAAEPLERRIMTEDNFADLSHRSYSKFHEDGGPGILITFSREGREI